METKPRPFSGCKIVKLTLMTSCSFQDARFDLSRKKWVNLKLKVRVKHIRLETMMNDLKLNGDGAVNVAKKNSF